jgi:hypothetical protein
LSLGRQASRPQLQKAINDEVTGLADKTVLQRSGFNP